MSYHGDIALGNTINIKFTTRQISGAPFTLAGTPVISAYIGNSLTQITAGITLSVDFDSVTGLNNVAIVASGANGFTTGTDIELVITTGTVNSVSVVGEVIGSFSIENRSAIRPATAGRTLVVDAAGLADANMVKAGPSGSGTAQTARDLGASVLLAGDFSATMKTSLNAATPASVTGNIGGHLLGHVAGDVIGNVEGSVASVSAAVSVTGDLSATMKTSVAAAVLDAAKSGHVVAGSIGEAIGDSGSDPLENPVPGSYAAGTAGAILGSIGNSETAGTVSDGSATTTGFTAAGTALNGDTDNFYSTPTPMAMQFTTGVLKGRSNKITGYTAATKRFAFARAWPLVPGNGDAFIVTGYIDG